MAERTFSTMRAIFLSGPCFSSRDPFTLAATSSIASHAFDRTRAASAKSATGSVICCTQPLPSRRACSIAPTSFTSSSRPLASPDLTISKTEV